LRKKEKKRGKKRKKPGMARALGKGRKEHVLSTVQKTPHAVGTRGGKKWGKKDHTQRIWVAPSPKGRIHLTISLQKGKKGGWEKGLGVRENCTKRISALKKKRGGEKEGGLYGPFPKEKKKKIKGASLWCLISTRKGEKKKEGENSSAPRESRRRSRLEPLPFFTVANGY